MNVPTLRRRRRRLVAIVVAAGLTVVAVGLGLSRLDENDTGSGAGSVALGGGGTMASCIVFSEEQLARAPIAFDGTVTSIEGDSVTLAVEHWYRGGDGDSVTVHAPDLAGAQALVGAVGFEEGGRYLVSADDVSGEIVPAVCGFTVTYSDDMAETFERAFA